MSYLETIRLYRVYSIPELITIFNSFNGSVQWLDSCIASDVLPISKLVRQYHVQIQKLLLTDATEPAKVKAKLCAKNIEDMVTHLQIHDAISQKLDHMCVFHTGLIHDLSNLADMSQLPHKQYLSVCFEIVEMNKVQLELIRTEYGQAVKIIQKDLIDTEVKMGPLHSEHLIPSSFPHYPAFEKAIVELIQRFTQVAATIDPLVLKAEDRAQKMHALATLFTMESERRVMSKILNGENTAAQAELFPDNDVDQTEFF